MLEYLNKKELDNIISIYCDSSNPETHLTGYLHTFDDEYLLIRHVTAHGDNDGFIAVRRQDVFRIDISGKYEKKIDILYKKKKQTHSHLRRCEKVLDDLLFFSCENKYIISVEIFDSFITGFVQLVDEELIRIIIIDEYGREDGSSLISKQDIISVSVDSQEEHCIQLLFEIDKRY